MEYVKELEKWLRESEAKDARRSHKDKHTVLFLAVHGDVKDAINAGYTKKTIWEHMRKTGKITSRYETFLKHIKRYITQSAEEPKISGGSAVGKNEQEKGKSGAKPPDERTPAKVAQPSKQIDGFKFDAKPNDKDLF